jgi:hypothetical protein
VEEKEDKRMKAPVKKALDPADVIEINARTFKVTERYIDSVIK